MKAQHYCISSISSDLPTEYAEFLKQFIEITWSISKLCLNLKARPFMHKIITHGPARALIVTARARELAGEKAAAAKTQIRELLNSGIIKSSSRMYANFIHMIRKKDNSWRTCESITAKSTAKKHIYNYLCTWTSLKNSHHNTFDYVLRDLDFIFVYVDGILVFSNNED
ncbi:uncharacterized protein LOC118450512 isoform X2 [Vespa mandarinia]|uniref:uncharacterized protein LOC118450512 isoform X2 n=1 Tax=Vespa mandarinia TaxID=7446 RepID=UPI00161E44E5|nr:uncharacterized protein LOC118450512 isoform X2 [Vespa mandarinia]